jgi:ligand-binding sensor domain-containing protein/serine phosphatase RsbU (regulator of sigma subunit)
MLEHPKVISAGQPGVFTGPVRFQEDPAEYSLPASTSPEPDRADSFETERSAFFLVNSTGDTIPTGVPIPARGRKEPCISPEPVSAAAPGMKDNASSDIKYLDVYHGLISSQVTSILEDRYGQIWFGTTAGGASRYNGQTFMNYTEEEGLCEVWIISSLEDRRGNLWFGTNGEGIVLYDGKTFTHFGEDEGLSIAGVNAILEDGHGTFWFATAGSGVCKYDGASFTYLTTNEGLHSNWITSICEDQKGHLWFGSTDQGVSVYEDNTFSPFAGNGFLDPYPVNEILSDNQGGLWFATGGGGIFSYQGTLLTHYTEKQGLGNNQVTSILEDSQGRLWFGTRGGGVNLFNGTSFTQLTEGEGLSGNWVLPMAEDDQGNIWCGTIGGGVSILDVNSFIHFTEKEGLSSRAVYSMHEDRLGNLWFGTMFGGLTLFDGETYRHYTVREGLINNTVESILEDRQGDLWFGTAAGVCRFQGDTFTHYSGAEGFEGFSVGSILEDTHGDIWFGTYGGGVIRYDGSHFWQYTEQEGLSSNYVESMLEDSRGHLWIGTLGGGLSRYDGDTITHFSEREGLSSNYIGCMFEDSQGNLWIGTMSSGISLFNGSMFTHFTKNEGLCDNLVQSIVEDNKGRIWLSTEDGLNLISYDPGQDSYNVLQFSLQDGLKGTNFLQNSVLLDSRNRLWWGSNKSLTMLDMNHFQIAEKAPLIHIDRIEINDQILDYNHLNGGQRKEVAFDSMARFFNYPLHLKLPYRDNHLTFHFSAIDWSAPHKVRYSFRMEGLEEAWSPSRSEPKAEYRNLPYGKHRFLVRATGEARTWSEPVEYRFSITPPWWHTWWARAAYAGLGILLILGIVRWRTSRLLKQQKVLESTVKERTVEISEKNEELRQQNEDLAVQRDKIQVQKDEIQAQKKAMTDSIEYAKRIQTATLPPDEELHQHLPEHFVLYRPLQIVSGDFYWLTQTQGKTVVAVADCTGHGVPGAFMSMLGSALLNDIAGKIQPLQAHLILNELRKQVIASLRQSGAPDEARDGMDIALCILDPEKLELQYAGAHQPLYHVRGGSMTVIKADRMPIGISSVVDTSFQNHRLSLKRGDTIYLCSDGYVDQVGGPHRKKFMTSRLKPLLLNIQGMSMAGQKAHLDSTLNDWMGLTGLHRQVYEQIDDVVVMGIRI